MRNGNKARAAILDAAEELFAESSFDIVPLRDVATKAGVPLGLINYHFQTKEKLYEAIIARRSEELNARRRVAYEALRKKPSLSDVIEMLLRPYLELVLTGGAGWHSYGRLLAQTGQQQRWTRLIARQFKETQEMFFFALKRADPRITEEAAARGYVHMTSVMVGLFAANDSLSLISRRAFSSRDLQRAYNFAMPFLVGGFGGLSKAPSVTSGKISQ